MKVGKIAASIVAIALIAGMARNAKAQSPDPERTKEDLRDAEAVSKRHRAELMKIPHVTVVTGEIDAQNDAAILVEVDDLKNVDDVTRQLPSQIEGFPVEVDDSNFVVRAGFLYRPPALREQNRRSSWSAATSS